MSVVTAECCECKAEGGRVLGNIDPAWLETVIPKQPPMVVMVVRGPHNGQVSVYPLLQGVFLLLYMLQIMEDITKLLLTLS